jgi:hypothetical protein
MSFKKFFLFVKKFLFSIIFLLGWYYAFIYTLKVMVNSSWLGDSVLDLRLWFLFIVGYYFLNERDDK